MARLRIAGLAGAVSSVFVTAVAAAESLPEPDPPVRERIRVERSEPGGSGDPGGPAISGDPGSVPSQQWLEHKTADGRHPDGNEQRMLWMMNRARQAPAIEGDRLATSDDIDVMRAVDYFGVDLAMLRSDFAALEAKAPAAFDRRLHEASMAHSLALIETDTQSHDGQWDRVDEAGFACASGRASVYAYSYSTSHSHAGLNIDWGFDEGGMQAPPGHRLAIMGVPAHSGYELTNVGIAFVFDPDPASQVGPYVFSAVYCAGGRGEFDRYLVGTVWSDLDGDGDYDAGEGHGNVEVWPEEGTWYAVTGEAGGYAIPITQEGAMDIRFQGGPLARTVARRITLGGTSTLLDLQVVPEPSALAAQFGALLALGALSATRRRDAATRTEASVASASGGDQPSGTPCVESSSTRLPSGSRK